MGDIFPVALLGQYFMNFYDRRWLHLWVMTEDGLAYWVGMDRISQRVRRVGEGGSFTRTMVKEK